MDKLIREQLNKCRVAKIPALPDDFTGEIFITKQDSNAPRLEINSSYLIEISNEYLASDIYKSHVESWNNGKPINHHQMKIAVSQFLSNMVKVDAVGYDDWLGKDSDTVYLGYWIPFEYISIIEKL